MIQECKISTCTVAIRILNFMQFIAMKLRILISNLLINEQNAAALAGEESAKHGFCEWMSRLGHLKMPQPYRWNFF